MAHPHADILTKLYEDFSKGNIPAVLAACDDKITFQVAGKSKLAGKFTKQTFPEQFLIPLMELTNGSLKIEVHDILANDRHAVVLASDHLVKNGKTILLRTVHVWRFEHGKPIAWYEYPRDLYAFDEVFQ